MTPAETVTALVGDTPGVKRTKTGLKLAQERFHTKLDQRKEIDEQSNSKTFFRLERLRQKMSIWHSGTINTYKNDRVLSKLRKFYLMKTKASTPLMSARQFFGNYCFTVRKPLLCNFARERIRIRLI